MQTTSWSCWFRIVSTRIAVLPVERSPMISSRCPRPTFVIKSIALIPVCSGSLTGWRSTTPRALNSSRPLSAGDPIADLQDGADLREVGLDVELLDPLLQDRRDLFGAKLQRFLLSRR